MFLSDEELGKKDDDHRGARQATRRGQTSWNPARPASRRTLKRLVLALLAVFCVYFFIHNIPTDVGIRDRRRPVYEHPDDLTSPRTRQRPPSSTPKYGASKINRKSGSKDATAQTYDGPVHFLELGRSLQAVTNTRGALYNKHVLFSAASLKSAAILLPIACQMGSELRSYVHFALMGRTETELDELRAVNGVDEACNIIFHDARPDYPSTSTQPRMRTSVARAIHHINNYLHPQAIVVDASSTEEPYFLEALRTKAKEIKTPVIDLPANSQKQLAYMTKLDSSSLSAWNSFQVDILIHATSGASGSLTRLLKSLSAADYTSASVPHLTIELPHNVDSATQRFLETFQWPPAHVDNPTNAKQLSIRRRIPRWSLKEEESSIRFLESFWPANPRDSHALVLSPQAELSPQFFHYLKYTVLEYRYSTAAQVQAWDNRLLGISLALPSTYLSGDSNFIPPTKRDVKPQTEKYPADGPTPFLWQAPNSDALLIFGQKWVELHGFVSRLFDITHRQPITPASFFSSKEVSKSYPSWLEHALRLSRARGYWTLYPGESIKGNVAVVHTELASPPEEYFNEQPSKDTEANEMELANGAVSVLDGLIPGKDGFLPPFKELPIMTWNGKVVALHAFDEAVNDYASEFREAVGGCEDLEPEDLVPKRSAADLFCEKEE